MVNVKKLLSLGLVSVMSLSILAGCGDAGAPASTSDSQPAAQTETKTETPAADTSADSGDASATTADGKTHINLYRCTFNLATPDSAQVQKVQDAINDYIGDKIGVEISLTDIGSGEYTEKANLALQSGEINLLWTASWEGTIGTNDLYPANAVYDLTDILPGTPLYDSMDAGQWEAAKYDGKIFFVPVY